MTFPKRKSSKKKIVRRSETFIEPVAIESAVKEVKAQKKKTQEEIDLEKKIFSIKQRVELGSIRQSVVQTDLRKMNKQLIRMRG